ncbi:MULTISPECIES: hypothetical protein [Rhizobium]|uniref:hypothetical protein n=1 Tax=Rhizobium TaxID=379 RepID=UPI001C9138E2|nr:MULTISPECIES: hypothetical protein [Rhizobium]MBY3173134.1 hypothetical protein [Rhizobium leguminosarum]MBY3366488.1 hypothetical protein [Rhizobium laguerreae]
MSNLELREFHSFLEELIEKSPRGARFNADRIIGTILSQHPQRIERIRDQVIALGLRALIRNNCRAKTSTTSNGPDLFGHYKVPRRVSVPYRDDKGRLQWDRKPRGELSFEDIDEIIARWEDRPKKPSKDRRDLDEIARRIEPYRHRAQTVGEALEMAERDGQ